MEYDFVILTTACSRSELHTQVLSEIPKFISNYKCEWIISIDKLNEDPEITKKNLYNILDSDNIDLEVSSSDRTAGRISWFKSVKWCINEGFKFKPRIGYFWLEDDWKLTTTEKLSINDLSNGTYISLVNRNELNFNPSIWSNDLFEKYMYKKINNEVMPDNGGNAERACCFKGDSPEATFGINMRVLDLFKDVGRDWASTNINGKRTFH